MSRTRQVQGRRLSKFYRAPRPSLAPQPGTTHCMAPAMRPPSSARRQDQIRGKTVFPSYSRVTAPCIRGRFCRQRRPYFLVFVLRGAQVVNNQPLTQINLRQRAQKTSCNTLIIRGFRATGRRKQFGGSVNAGGKGRAGQPGLAGIAHEEDADAVGYVLA